MSDIPKSCEECECVRDDFIFVHCARGGFLLDRDDCDYSKECDPRCPFKEVEHETLR